MYAMETNKGSWQIGSTTAASCARAGGGMAAAAAVQSLV